MDFANARPLRLAIAELEPKAGERILDAGCGTGAALAAIRATAACELYGIDLSGAMVTAAERRLGANATLLRGEIEHLPAEWPRFDAAFALNVLYFADPAGKLVAGLHGALRYGGRLVAYVSDRPTMERWPFARAGFHRLYDAAELTTALVDGGFARASISIKEYALAPGISGLIAHAER